MNSIFRVVFALLVGAGTFLATLIATTELLTPHVWPALLVSLPVAVVAGCLGIGYTYLGLRYRDERNATGSAAPQTVALLGGFSVAALGFVVTVTIVTAVLGAFAVPLFATTLLVSFPAGILVGVVAGLLVVRRLGRHRTKNGGEGGTATKGG